MACPQPRRDAELTVYPGVDHDSWTRTYDLSADHDIYDWLLGFTVSGPAIAESTGATTAEDTIAAATESTTPGTMAARLWGKRLRPGRSVLDFPGPA